MATAAPPVESQIEANFGQIEANFGKLDILLFGILSLCIFCILFPGYADAVMHFCLITVPSPPEVNRL